MPLPNALHTPDIPRVTNQLIIPRRSLGLLGLLLLPRGRLPLHIPPLDLLLLDRAIIRPLLLRHFWRLDTQRPRDHPLRHRVCLLWPRARARRGHERAPVPVRAYKGIAVGRRDRG